MAVNPLFRQIARAMALGDGDRAKGLIADIPDHEGHAYHTYMTAVFSCAVEHRFKDDNSQEAIRRFVEEMRHDYRTAEPPLKAFAMEGLLRAFFGEEHLMDEISADDQLRCELLAIRKIVHQSTHMKEHLDDYLTDAEGLAAEWTSEGE